MKVTFYFEGGVVAHGFYPMDGNLHFDASEKWTLNLDDGINLYQASLKMKFFSYMYSEAVCRKTFMLLCLDSRS